MHYACSNCKRVFFESNQQGICPECGGQLVSSQSASDVLRAPEGEAAARPDPETLMGEDFFGGATWPADAPAPAVAAVPQTSQLPQAGPGQTAPPPASTLPAQPSGGPQPVVRGPSTRRVLGIAGVAVLGVMVLILAVLLLRSSSGTSPSDRAGGAETAALAERAAELLSGNAALRKENTELSAAKGELQAEIDALKGRIRKLAKARRLTLGAAALVERRSKLDRALRMADAALEIEPELAEANRVKGRALAAMGRPQEALKAFDAAGAADIEALVLAGETCLTDLGDREAALEYFDRAADLKTGGAFGLVAEARQLFLSGDWARAVSRAQQARRADPTLALAPLVIGEATFERALRLSAQAGSGEAKRALLERADPFLVEALKLGPNSAHACVVRGRLLIEQTRLTSPERGFGLARFSRQDEAARLLQKAKMLSPRRPDVYVVLGRLRLEKGALHNPGLARTFAQEAVNLTEGRDATALATLASAYAASGSPAEAAKTVEKALRVDPDNDKLRSDLVRYRAEARATSPRRPRER